MSNETLLGLPSAVLAGIAEHLSARDLCTLAEVRTPQLGFLAGAVLRWFSDSEERSYPRALRHIPTSRKERLAAARGGLYGKCY